MAYVPKPDENPSSTQQRSIDSEDTHMEDGTAEEEKESTQPNESNDQNARTSKRTDGASKMGKR
jgi:hypothetical protein